MVSITSKRSVIIGATDNPSRYAYLAAMMLTEAGHDIFPVGIRKGELFGRSILDLRSKPDIPDVDTVTLYINARHQAEWEDYILSLKPNRIIFNPGAENESFKQRALQAGIVAEYACTLVLIRSGQY